MFQCRLQKFLQWHPSMGQFKISFSSGIPVWDCFNSVFLMMFQCTLQVFAGSPSGLPVYSGSTIGNLVAFQCTVYPKKYAHGFCFAVLCCGYTLTDFPISTRLTLLALWQSNDCPSASKATLMNMDKYIMWINYERLHNHNKEKHNKTGCIFLGIYCTLDQPVYTGFRVREWSITSLICWFRYVTSTSNTLHREIDLWGQPQEIL